MVTEPPDRVATPTAGLPLAVQVLTLMLMLHGGSVSAQDRIEAVGLFQGGAVLIIDGGTPRTLRVGQASREGVRLLSADGEKAVVEINGRRETLTMGQSVSAQRSLAGRQKTVLTADGQGHFWASAEINGTSARVLVDTGATFVSMSNATARRLGINYLDGQKGFTSTANGTVPVFRVRLASVRIGDISLNNIEASVHEGNNLPVILLGMSFLNRVEMQRDGERMILIRRF